MLLAHSDRTAGMRRVWTPRHQIQETAFLVEIAVACVSFRAVYLRIHAILHAQICVQVYTELVFDAVQPPRTLHPETQYKKPRFQCNLYQECGFLYVSLQCMTARWALSGTGIEHMLRARYAMSGTDLETT
eukprot:1965219-Rhodomonas_salina.1